MGPRMVYRLATSNDEQTRTILDNTIFLLIPSFNPDGHDIVGEWVKKTAGTPYEGSAPAELYSHYVGHDNNRDGYMLSQAESQLWAKVVYQEWTRSGHAPAGTMSADHPAEDDPTTHMWIR
jgi:murein tripeptide amidase MpaA